MDLSIALDESTVVVVIETIGPGVGGLYPLDRISKQHMNVLSIKKNYIHYITNELDSFSLDAHGGNLFSLAHGGYFFLGSISNTMNENSFHNRTFDEQFQNRR